MTEQNAQSQHEILINTAQGFLTSQSTFARSIDNVRVAFEQGQLNKSDIVLWPSRSVYICADAAVAMFSTLVRSSHPDKLNDEQFMELAVQIPSVTLTYQSWIKNKLIIEFSKQYSDEELESFSKITCEEISKLPCWGVAIDVSNQNLIWNDRPAKYIVASRYFLTNGADENNANPIQLPGENAAILNNITTNVISDDGASSLGPVLTLLPGLDVATSNQTIIEQMLSFNLELIKSSENPGIDTEEFEKSLRNSFKSHCKIFNLLAHAIKTIDSLETPLIPELPGVVLEESTKTNVIGSRPDPLVVQIQ